MADRNDGALQAAIKALEHAVLPAVNPADPLAGEQLRLVVGYLKLLRQRLDYVEDRKRFELEHYRTLAEALQDDARTQGGEVAQRFEAALREVKAAERPCDVPAATAAVASAVSGLVRVVADADPERRRRIEQTVARHSKRWIDAQRAWFAPLGFELRPEQLPALADAKQAARPQA